MEINKKNSYAAYAISFILITTLYFLITFLIGNKTINNYYLGIIIMICVNIILAVSLNISTGFLGQLVLGHAAFMYIGAYAAAIFSLKFTVTTTAMFLLSLVVGGLFAAIFGFIIGLPALRLKGDYLAIITLGFGQIVKNIINNMEITGGSKGLMAIPKLSNFTVTFFVTVVSVAIITSIINSRHGRAMISIREDEIAAESCGVSTTFYKVFGFMLSAFFAGIAGGLYAHHLTILMPKNIGFEYSIEILLIVVLGGMGSITGSVVAAIILTILPEALRTFSDYRMLIYSLILVVMMIYKPSGLMGNYEFSITRIIGKFKRKDEA